MHNPVRGATVKRPTVKSDTNEFDMLVDVNFDVQTTIDDVVPKVSGEWE